MGKLSKDEEEMYERLERKRKAPDPEPINKSVHFTVDLGKKDQVELARKLRLLDDDDGGGDGDKGDSSDDDEGGGGAGGRKPDKTPRRGGYFG